MPASKPTVSPDCKTIDFFADMLPRNPAGKILKNELKRLFVEPAH
jgi:acyl-coenzyme A synthetase/AMP-(fatty) acid ligase